MKKLINFLKEPFVWFIVFPAVGFLLWGGLNYTGFCWTEKRWLSNEERIDIAIAEVIKHSDLRFKHSVIGVKGYEIIPYSSIKEFKQKNPDCCYIASYPGAISSHWIDKWLGYQPSSVPIIWIKDFYTREGEIYEHVYKIGVDLEETPYIPINSCGILQNRN